MLLLDLPRPARDDALLGHEKLRFVALAAHVLNAAYDGVLADDLVDRNHPDVCYARVSIDSLPHRGVTKLFNEGSRLAHFDLAEGAGDVTFVHALSNPGSQAPEYVSVFRKGTADKLYDGYHRLDLNGPFEMQWNSEVGTPLDIVGLHSLTQAIRERLDV